MSRTPTSEAASRAPTLWTTLRDFCVVVVACVACAVALYALASPARAGGDLPPQPDYHSAPPTYYAPPVRAGWTACAPDVRRYCPNVLPGGGRILSCLAGNKDRLTLACHDALVRAWAYTHR